MIQPNGSTQLLALFGAELSMSPSPATHTAWAQQAGLNWLYLPLSCRDDSAFIDLCSALMECSNFQGGNITNPFKRIALNLPGIQLDASAEQCGAANTLYRKGEGKQSVWCLANTDLVGCSETLSRILSPDCGSLAADTEPLFVILGTGAMAGTCAQAIADICGHQHSTRTIQLSRAQLEGGNAGEPLHYTTQTQLVVINTLPSGTHPDADRLACTALEGLNNTPAASKHLFEISYLETGASKKASTFGWDVVRGDLLFEEQARASFKLWARCSAPTPTTALQLSRV